MNTAFTDLALGAARELFATHAIPPYRAGQVWNWLYQRAATSYRGMTTLPRELQDALAALVPLTRTQIVHTAASKDGTQKYLIQLADGDTVETVWIPMGAHATVCVSTQVGCPIQCVFCASGADGLRRNLSPGEMVEQVWHCVRLHGRERVNNVVFMGMGEPLLNYPNLCAAIAILNDRYGLHIGARHVTVSTAGVIPGIRQLAGDAPQVNLAVSLHAATDALRARLIRHCPSFIAGLMLALAAYYRVTHRLITFEYVLLDGVNDSERDANALARLAQRVPSKVNLIPYNAVPGGAYQPTSAAQAKRFVEWLSQRGVTALLRARKGDDISAACGQLRRRAITHDT